MFLEIKNKLFVNIIINCFISSYFKDPLYNPPVKKRKTIKKRKNKKEKKRINKKREKKKIIKN